MKKKSEVRNEDRLSRYLLNKRHFNTAENRVKPNAFMPPKANPELSVYVTTEKSDHWIWKTGISYVAKPMKKELFGRADIAAIIPHDLKLQVEVTNDPAAGHANIVGFPQDRELQRLKAARLASEAELVLRTHR